MWQAECTSLNSTSLKVVLTHAAGALPYSEVITLWQTSEAFRGFFIRLLRDAPFDAYRWETPPLTKSNVHRDFQFVLLDCPELNCPAQRDAFAEHFTEAPIAVFPNLSGDARLVVPSPTANDAVYPHLGAFMRGAPLEQLHEFWSTVGSEMEERISTQPLWLSSAGMGIAWLHLRLDDRPKYYGHMPYRSVD